MRIIYIISRLLTFPGAYMRCFWEHLTCRLFAIPVESDGYLRIDEACGHIEHAFPESRVRAYFIAAGPGFMNFITGLPMFAAGVTSLYTLGFSAGNGIRAYIFYIALSYVGGSLLCNCFPLVEDALFLWDRLYGSDKANLFCRIILFIPTVRTIIGAYIEKYAVSVLLYAAAAVVMAITA